jgi:hypothetical protein
MEPEVSSPCPQHSDASHILIQIYEDHILMSYFLKVHFNIILPSISYPNDLLRSASFHHFYSTILRASLYIYFSSSTYSLISHVVSVSRTGIFPIINVYKKNE